MTLYPCDQWALIHGPAPREQSPLLFRRASLFFPPSVVFPAYLAPLRHRINGSQSFQLLHSFGEGAPFAEGMQRFSSAFRRFASSTAPSSPPPRRGFHAPARRGGRGAVEAGTRLALAGRTMSRALAWNAPCSRAGCFFFMVYELAIGCPALHCQTISFTAAQTMPVER